MLRPVFRVPRSIKNYWRSNRSQPKGVLRAISSYFRRMQWNISAKMSGLTLQVCHSVSKCFKICAYEKYALSLQRIHLAIAQSNGCAFFMPVFIKKQGGIGKLSLLLNPLFLSKIFAGAKVLLFFDICKFYRIIRAKFTKKYRIKGRKQLIWEII